LIVGADAAGVERLLPPLRQAGCEVDRAVTAADGVQRTGGDRFDLVAVVLPLEGVRSLLAAVRAAGSPCLHAGMLVLDGDLTGKSIDPALIRLANRMLPGDAPDEDLRHAITMLLGVAPRVPVHGSARLRLNSQESERLLTITNVSESGMLVRGGETLPVGARCGFELQLPEQSGPIRGRAQVVRRQGEQLGVTFLAFGGEGEQVLSRLVQRQIAGVDEKRVSKPRAATTPADVAAPDAGSAAARGDDAAARAEKELAELLPALDQALRAGLAKRLGIGDWYVTGAATGLESLRDFSAILEAVHRGDARTPESTQRLADLAMVREKLAEFAKPQQGVLVRTEILLEIRPALDRLLRQLATGGHLQESAVGQQRDAIAQLGVEVKRLLRARASLESLRLEIAELQRPRYLVARPQLRRRAEELGRQYRGHGHRLGIDRTERLMGRRGRRSLAFEVEREIGRLDDWLAAIHKQVYAGKRRPLASGKLADDLAEQRLHPLAGETLAAGYEYLVRAHGAYRHALEMAGADPALLDRVGDLAADIAARRLQRAAGNALRTDSRAQTAAR